MAELANCSRCNDVFVKSLRDICNNCYMKEEEAFQTVYQFLRQWKNREATLFEIVEATHVDEGLIIKFIREQRLQISDFPKLFYRCERCEKSIIKGRMCKECSVNILEGFTKQGRVDPFKVEHRQEEKVDVYYTFDKHKE